MVSALVTPVVLIFVLSSRVIKTVHEIEVLRYTNRISSMAHKEVRSCNLDFVILCFYLFLGNACH